LAVTKEAVIVLRVEAETKRRFEQAAQCEGVSMTRFLTTAGEQYARRVERKPVKGGVHGGLPSYLRMKCFEAGQGGASGYEAVGHTLASALGAEQPWDTASFEDWAEEVQALLELLDSGRDVEALAWFHRHFPKIMALVPRRRRPQFLRGVSRAREEDKIAL
jgi:hypothetical protein